ncbi:SCO family protein [Aurantimonas sp. VKM B-3413]|uniref:SCO family protein n=1 Tax=Aurantimonas sp. VKM B-3413 TaxID=2779401 RepID=UPI001E2BDCB0|nr:SCO family protein [Aurantimonas sp. VKM B-3413]MCB8837904.1 SCO family protein [Aurantimonas sp. VKM B-3413]
MTGTQALRVGLWAVAALIAGALAALVVVFSGGGPTAGEAYGKPFALVDQNGQEITEAALRGKPSAVFFGYTHCPDVCPTTLYELAGYQKQLEEAGGDLQVVFVTVDPERDTPAVLKDYVEAVSKDVTAISGDPAKVEAMAKGWGVYFKKVGEGDGYTMDHTATTFLIDRDGKLAGTIAYGEDPKIEQQKLEKLVGV